MRVGSAPLAVRIFSQVTSSIGISPGWWAARHARRMYNATTSTNASQAHH
jgi:hypothetical protein